jgi:hypothetical protein
METKKAIPAILGLALICFFLPFVTVSCQGQKLLTLTGVQLVTGTTVQVPQMFGPSKEEKIPGDGLARLACLSGLVGLLAAIVAKNKGKTVAAALAGLGAILLLVMKSRVENEVLRAGSGLFQVEFGGGYWATVSLFLSTVGARLLPTQKSVRLPLQAVWSQSQDPKFCTQCGTKNEATDSFCKECGTKFA